MTSFPAAPEPAARATVAANEAASLGQLTCGGTCLTSCGGGGHRTRIPPRGPGDPRRD